MIKRKEAVFSEFDVGTGLYRTEELWQWHEDLN